MPRKDLCLAEKIALLDRIKKISSRTSHRLLAELTGVPKSTISRIIAQEESLRKEWNTDKEGGVSFRRKRLGKRHDLEEALSRWFYSESKEDSNISLNLLKEKADELAQELGYEDFKASDGWIYRWKIKRDHIYKKKENGTGFVQRHVSEDWLTVKLPFLLKLFLPKNIYTCDETGLMYSAAPDGSLRYSYESIEACPEAMDNLTVLCCTNMSGTDKRKLMVIGKDKNPVCFKGLRRDSLPVHYYSSKNAYMRPDVFEDWLSGWDSELQREDRKIVLILNNCTAHSCIKNNLVNIQLEYIPEDTSALMQPMDMGIIKNLKTLYRAKLVARILEMIEDGLLDQNSPAAEVSKNIDVLQALTLLAESWRDIKPETIQTSFALCGFKYKKAETPQFPEVQGEVVSLLERVPFYDDYVCIDIGIYCHPPDEDCDEELETAVSMENLQEDPENQDERLGCYPQKVTVQEARRFVSGLRRFFMQEDCEGSPLTSLDTCADFVQTQSVKRLKLVNPNHSSISE